MHIGWYPKKLNTHILHSHIKLQCIPTKFCCPFALLIALDALHKWWSISKGNLHFEILHLLFTHSTSLLKMKNPLIHFTTVRTELFPQKMTILPRRKLKTVKSFQVQGNNVQLTTASTANGCHGTTTGQPYQTWRDATYGNLTCLETLLITTTVRTSFWTQKLPQQTSLNVAEGKIIV